MKGAFRFWLTCAHVPQVRLSVWQYVLRRQARQTCSIVLINLPTRSLYGYRTHPGYIVIVYVIKLVSATLNWNRTCLVFNSRPFEMTLPVSYEVVVIFHNGPPTSLLQRGVSYEGIIKNDPGLYYIENVIL